MSAARQPIEFACSHQDEDSGLNCGAAAWEDCTFTNVATSRREKMRGHFHAERTAAAAAMGGADGAPSVQQFDKAAKGRLF